MSFSQVPPDYQDCCACVVEYLYIGDRKAAKSLPLLEQLGITHIVNVTPPKQQGGVHNFFESDERFSYLRLPVVDSDVEDVSPYFREGMDFIHQARKQGHSVLVHCQQGVSRSATIVIAYLICYGIDEKTPPMDLKSAYTFLKTVRPTVKPKSNFLKQLIALDHQNTLERKQLLQKQSQQTQGQTEQLQLQPQPQPAQQPLREEKKETANISDQPNCVTVIAAGVSIGTTNFHGKHNDILTTVEDNKLWSIKKKIIGR